MLKSVIECFSEFIEWEDYNIIPICFGACLANICEGEPVYLLLVGPPSSGKTELIRSLGKNKAVYELSKLNPRTLISGYIQKSKSVGKDKSLLVRLTNEGKTIMAIKDLTSLLSMRAEDKAEVFGQFREIADGYCSQPYGTGEEVRWRGKLGVLAGVTGAIDDSFAMRQSLGERFLQVRIAMPNLDAIMEKALKTAGKEKEWRKKFQETVEIFFTTVGKPDLTHISVEPMIVPRLFHLAHLVSLGRTGVKRDPYTKTLLSLPESEGPARLVKQLTTLGRGIAACLNEGIIGENIYKLLKRVGKDTLPAIREKCLRIMWKDELNNKRRQTTVTLSAAIGCSKETIKMWLENLKEVGLLYKQDHKDGALWELSSDGFLLIQQSGIYEDLLEHGEEETYGEYE